MSVETINQRLRTFLFVTAGFIFIGTVVELLLSEHIGTATQYIPFFLSGLGLIAIVSVLLAPQRGTLLGLRGVMGLVVLGSLFGIFEHIEHNIEFALEIQPNAVLGDVFLQALSGASPLLAPGILALGGLLAIAATYYHPLMQSAKSLNIEVTA